MDASIPGAARARTLALDGLLATALGAVMVLGTQRAALFQTPWRRPLDVLAYALLAAAAAALAGRRLAPLPSLAAVTLVTAGYLALGYPYGPVFLAPVVVLYTVGARLPPRRSVPAAGAAVLALLLPELARLDPARLPADLVAMAMWHIWLLVPWAIGAGLRARREGARRDREEAARRLAYEERLRIAREVHDVVGHGLAVISMQAGVALHVVDRRPEQARVALEAIKQTSRDALEELRATLAVFRRPDDESDSRRPAPGLGQVEGVVEAMAESGLPVDLMVTGRPVALPAAVDLAAYRIVQESLTNVVRHAGSTTATVRVHYEPGEVVLEITDGGRARPNGVGDPGGHGIAGMRERAAAVQGTLEAGPRSEGGFRVLARLPTGGRRE